MGLSIAMIVLGVLSVILEPVFFIIYFIPTQPTVGVVTIIFHVLSVINGLAFIATGGLGVFSAKKPSRRGTIKALMALNIISACLTVPRLFLNGLLIVSFSEMSAMLTLTVVLFILGLAGGTISIMLSAWTCSTICCLRTEAVGTVRYTPAAVSDGAFFTSHKKAIMGLSIAMIVLGVLSVILEPVFFIIYFIPTQPTVGVVTIIFHVLSVINGLAFIATGGLGVFSAKKPSRRTIQALMALTIISACLTVPSLVHDGFSIVWFSSWSSTRMSVLSVVLYIIGLAGGTISVVLSAWTCSAICCLRTKAVGTVRYTPAAVSDGGQ